MDSTRNLVTKPAAAILPLPSGEMVERVKNKDWASTPLGPRAGWPRSLRTLVDTLLVQPFPMVVLWGPKLVQIYNDGYRVIAGGKHPGALGQPNYECWPEAMDFTKPAYDRVLAGESLSFEDQKLTLIRGGEPEEVFLTFGYSPVKDDEEKIAGLLCIIFETTAKKKAELAMGIARATAERLAEEQQLALDAAEMGWWHYDATTKRVFLDRRLRKIYGVTSDYLTYEDVLAQIPEEDAGKLREVTRVALSPLQTHPYMVEYRVRGKDGVERLLQSRGQGYFLGEGENRRVAGIFGTAVDITASRRAEAAIAESAERLSLALAAAEQGDWEWEPITDRMTLSARISQIFGLEPDCTITRSQMRELIHQDDRLKAKQALADAVSQHRDYDVEYRVKRFDGSYGWVSAKGRGLYDATGKITRMLGVVQDITARKEAEEEREHLLQSIDAERARLRAAFMRSPAFMCVLRGPEYVFEFANERYYQLVGHREIVGKTVRAAIPEVISQGYLDLLDRVYNKGEPFAGRDMLLRLQITPDGPLVERYIDFVYEPVTEADGSISGIFVHGVDTTEQKKAVMDRESLLESERRARADAEQANRMKDDFLATVSHELRTPLSAILGWSQVLRESSYNPADVKEGLETIERNARAQTQIVDDLLDMSRIISGKIRLDVQRIDLAAVVKAGVETVRSAAEVKGIRMLTVLDPLLSPIKGDPNRLQQVIWNLLSNAVKFTPKNGKVQVTLERIESHIEMSVSDTGAGIESEFLPFVFDRFRQSDSSIRRRHGGLGLGLAIVKQLVELHGGSVRVKSPGLGQGATFVVSLPLMPLHPEHDEELEGRHPEHAEKSAETSPKTGDELKDVRVLVVDDENDARLLVKRILGERGAKVVAAASVAEALAYLLDQPFDVLVSDIGMPEEDGYVLIERVRALAPEQGGTIPALALTAYARSEDRVRAISAGFQMHLVKPVETAELVVMVASLARLKRA